MSRVRNKIDIDVDTLAGRFKFVTGGEVKIEVPD